MGIKIGVAADDVTGANDTGSTFGNGGFRSAVFPLGLTEGRNMEEEARGLDVIIIDTDSRFDEPEEAAGKVRRATEILMSLGCDRYFKKTCSVFRGNIGAEFDSMQDTIGQECAMVILGFPKNGRTTLDGIHYVYGKKLENSQFRSDPIHPMTISFLPDILHRQSSNRTGIITFRDLDLGLSHVLEKKERLKKECSYILFDIRDQSDLKFVAQAVAGERMLCGSSAIGEMLPEFYRQLRVEKVLTVAGSLTRQEAGKLISKSLCRVTGEVLERTGIRNLVVAGGDTSAAVTMELGIYRMEIGREIEAGVPVMTGRSRLGMLNLVLKSGSFGSEEFLQKAADAVGGKWND